MASYRHSKYTSPSQRMYRGFSNESSLHTIIEDESLSLFTDSYAPSEGTFCGSPRSEWKQMDIADDDSLRSPSIQSSSDSDSTVSTNFTESNIPGAGRMLGKLYSSAGKKLEKAMARFVNRAGYGPEASYTKLLDLYRDEKRDITDAEAKDLLKHCQKLLDYASSDINSTKLLAIEKLLGIFKIHKLVAFVISADSGDLHSRFMDLSMSIERTAYRTAPEYTQRVYDTALSEFSKMEIHRAGVNILSSKDRTSDVLLRDALMRLVAGLRNCDTAPLSLWYLQWLPGLSIDILFDPLLALDLCDSLATALTDDEIFESVDRENLIEISLYTHEYLLHHLEFLTPFRYGRSLREYLSIAGAAALDEFVDYKDSTLRIQQVIDVMNDFATAFNRRCFQHYPEMEMLHDYQSIELVYERICSALDELDNPVTVAQVRSLETIIMKLCIELLDYTSSDTLADKLFAIEKLGIILREKDVFAWFLSAGPSDLEASILALIQSIETMCSFESMSEYSDMLRIAKMRFSLVSVHKAGVDLLEARGEKLRLASHAIKPDWDSNSLLYSDWKTSWTAAFRSLLIYLDSDSPKAASLALEYLCCSCWAFPYSPKPAHAHRNSLLEQSLSELDPQLALELCRALRGILVRDNVFWAVHKNFLFWVSARMIKYLLARLDFVKRFCDGKTVEESVDFEGTKLHVPTVIALLTELGDAHKARAVDAYSHYADQRLYSQLLEMKESAFRKADSKPEEVATVDAA